MFCPDDGCQMVPLTGYADPANEYKKFKCTRCDTEWYYQEDVEGRRAALSRVLSEKEIEEDDPNDMGKYT